MKGRSVLISGAGVASPGLAYWLDRHGLVPTLVERAPALRRGGATRVEEAFARYENLLQPFMLEKQKGAEGFAGSFAPKTRFGIFFRNQVTKLFNARPLAKLAFSRSVLDRMRSPTTGKGAWAVECPRRTQSPNRSG